MGSSGPGRVRVERGINRQPNGSTRSAGAMPAGCASALSASTSRARRERLALIAATRE